MLISEQGNFTKIVLSSGGWNSHLTPQDLRLIACDRDTNKNVNRQQKLNQIKLIYNIDVKKAVYTNTQKATNEDFHHKSDNTYIFKVKEQANSCQQGK